MIAVGVDTHNERHYAVALDHLGQMLAELVFSATTAGYYEPQRWAEGLAGGRDVVSVIERAGRWGAGLCEHLVQGRRDRRAGKADRIDAIAAAKRVLADENVSTPRGRGILTAIRALLIARRSAVAERTRVLNQLQALTATAPIALRERTVTAPANSSSAGSCHCAPAPRSGSTSGSRLPSCATLPSTRERSVRTPSATRTSSQTSSGPSTRPSRTGPESDRSPQPSCSPAIPGASRTRRRSHAATHRSHPGVIRQDRLPTQPWR
jgi:hypothetical protein